MGFTGGTADSEHQVPEGTGRHLLGPHVVGQRVVVRRVLVGETGPTGGPAMTDVLGVCERWGDGRVLIRREDGEAIEIETALIVSGKPVPPRPTRWSRLAPGFFQELLAPRWLPTPDDPDDPDDPDNPAAPTLLQVAGVATLARSLRDAPEATGVETVHLDRLTPDWLVGNDAALAHFDAVARDLDLPDQTFLELRRDGRQVARGRVHLVGDWAVFADLTVQPDARRAGLATRVLADLVEWSAERGATAMLLTVDRGNQPATALYAQHGFRTHHAGRSLRAVELQHRVTAMWPGLETERWGDWLVLANPSADSADRTDIAMAVGFPDRPLTEAVAAMPRDRVRVLADSDVEGAFVQAGWRHSDDPDAALLVAVVPASDDTPFRVERLDATRVRVHAAHSASPDDGNTDTTDTADTTDTVDDMAASITATLDGPFLGLNGLVAASADQARSAVAAALAWGAQAGARVALTGLHHDHPWVAAHEALGFTEHHRYRYVVRAGSSA